VLEITMNRGTVLVGLAATAPARYLWSSQASIACRVPMVTRSNAGSCERTTTATPTHASD